MALLTRALPLSSPPPHPLRIGHVRPTHTFLIVHDTTPHEKHRVRINVKHINLQCTEYTAMRTKYCTQTQVRSGEVHHYTRKQGKCTVFFVYVRNTGLTNNPLELEN